MQKEFTLRNVLILRPYQIVSIAIIVMSFVVFIFYYANIFPYLKVFMTFIIILLAYRILMLFIKEVKISFDNQYLYIFVDEKKKKYLKSEVIGFYSYDYIYTNNVPSTSFKFKFSDGSILEISELGMFPGKKDIQERNDSQKTQQLKSLLSTLQKELGFKIVKKNRLRYFFKTGYYWYSKA